MHFDVKNTLKSNHNHTKIDHPIKVVVTEERTYACSLPRKLSRGSNYCFYNAGQERSFGWFWHYKFARYVFVHVIN